MIFKIFFKSYYIVEVYKPHQMFYLVLCFHPRILVSSLLQSVGIHLEWEANPSELLSSKKQKQKQGQK